MTIGLVIAKALGKLINSDRRSELRFGAGICHRGRSAFFHFFHYNRQAVLLLLLLMLWLLLLQLCPTLCRLLLPWLQLMPARCLVRNRSFRSLLT